MKKRITLLMLSVVLVLAMAVTASAEWSKKITANVPNFNGSYFTPATERTTKSTDDTQCTFQTYSNQAKWPFGVDGRIVNSNHDARSDWVRNMYSNTTLYAPCWATKNYYAYAELSTDLLEPQWITVSFRCSPDSE